MRRKKYFQLLSSMHSLTFFFFFKHLKRKSHLFILPAAWQRVLSQVHLGAIFVVDLSVQVVLLPAAALANYFLLAVATWIRFGLFSVLKAQRGRVRSNPIEFLTAPVSKLCLQRGLVSAHPVDSGAHLVMLR